MHAAPPNPLYAHSTRHHLWSCWAVAFLLIGTPNCLLLLKAFALIGVSNAWWTSASLALALSACAIAGYSVLYSVRCAAHERTSIVMHLLWQSSDAADGKAPESDNVALALFASLLTLTIVNSSIHQTLL